jgi:hypothetical protein
MYYAFINDKDYKRLSYKQRVELSQKRFSTKRKRERAARKSRATNN